MSPRKMRIVANLVRGKRVDQAMAMLTHTPKRAGRIIKKLLISAVAQKLHGHKEKLAKGVEEKSKKLRESGS